MSQKSLTAASIRPIMLSILAEGRSYGYAIMQRIHELSGGDVQLSDGTLYPVLHRLEVEGLIESNTATAENGRRRKYYKLTPAGHQSLVTEREKWMKVHSMLVKLWGPALTPAT
jgi:PadR family transcriptional regulator